VPRSRKLALIARATGSAVIAPAGQPHALAPLPAISYLVNAAAAPLVPAPQARHSRVWRKFDERVARAVEMYSHLIEHDRLSR